MNIFSIILRENIIYIYIPINRSVGSAGIGATQGVPTSGGNSIFSTITAVGGGKAANSNSCSLQACATGGSGGKKKLKTYQLALSQYSLCS